MEIKRKKITAEEIFASEQKLAKEVSALCAGYADAFAAVGHELDLEFGQKEDEAENAYSAFSTEENKDFDAGYVSRALITVKRRKTEDEIAADEAAAEENKQNIAEAENEDAAEQLENDETLRVSEGELSRSVAFTEVMLVRTYKSFWTEWVSICDSLGEVEGDLKEFLASL